MTEITQVAIAAPKPEPTPAVRMTLDALRAVIARDEWASVRTVAKERNCSISTAHAQLVWLRNAGYITWVTGRPNTMRIA